MLDQSNIVQNMSAAFELFAPNLLENIRTSCKSQIEERLTKSKERESEEFDQKNNSKFIKDRIEFVEK